MCLLEISGGIIPVREVNRQQEALTAKKLSSLVFGIKMREERI
jgi:hypothetical protein